MRAFPRRHSQLPDPEEPAIATLDRRTAVRERSLPFRHVRRSAIECLRDSRPRSSLPNTGSKQRYRTSPKPKASESRKTQRRTIGLAVFARTMTSRSQADGSVAQSTLRLLIEIVANRLMHQVAARETAWHSPSGPQLLDSPLGCE